MNPIHPKLRHEVHEADLCVVGGGMAGLCAALSAARHGVRVVLMHDRPVLGGNASSETRVHITGADRAGQIPNMRETGILEELRLENLRRNPNHVFALWDTILYEKLHYHPNVTLLLNCSCLDAEPAGPRIRSIRGWQLTTYTYHTVRAAVYADCSGDGVLAPLTGAEFRVGRESRDEFDESIAPPQADLRTMGMTCLFQAREHDSPQTFEPPSWAYRFDRCENLPYGAGGHRWRRMGYWWVELGGAADSIHDTERLRDELLKIVYGVWDHIKNRCTHRAENWALEWIQFLPAKRESRRYVGDHILTQRDIEAEGRFPDLAAYGGWSMDDHDPEGFWAVRIGHPATIFHPAPSPFGIPYRCLYSRNVENLMFAGRDASCTHAAMSSTRVMGTGCTMGQAVGTAAALAVQLGIDPRAVNGHIERLQQMLIDDDCYLPWVREALPALTTESRLTASRGNPEPVRDGVRRPVGSDEHAWGAEPGDWIAYEFGAARRVTDVSLVLDSALDQYIQMSYHHAGATRLTTPPPSLPKELRLDVLHEGEWRSLHEVKDNFQRHVRLPVGRDVAGVRVTIQATWGAPGTRVFAFKVRHEHGE